MPFTGNTAAKWIIEKYTGRKIKKVKTKSLWMGNSYTIAARSNLGDFVLYNVTQGLHADNKWLGKNVEEVEFETWPPVMR